ncbi:MAG: LysR family transcriptional regulator [Rhodocyclaceae bacterium]|nr:LysR family transcriptional regulator [Rhodocyclaceae bacterium]
MDRLTAMRVFAEVVERGSFSAAAERLDLSRAMVTRHVAALEHWLDVRLLQRTTRRLSLTEAGEQCLRRSRQVLELADELEADVVQQADDLRGELRITCAASFGQTHLAPAIADFLTPHPRLTVTLEVGDAAVDLVRDRIDMAIRITAEADPGLVARPLARCRSLLVAAPAYLARQGVPARPEDLGEHRCLGHARFGRGLWRLTRDGEVREIAVPVRFATNETMMMTSAARAGAGIGLQPRYLAAPLIADGSLVVVLPDWQPPELTIQALYPSRRRLSPAVRALLDFLVVRFASEAW